MNFPLFDMSDMDDYEALPASASLSVTCAAGALAGVAEHCVMFPIDSVKVMWRQCLLRRIALLPHDMFRFRSIKHAITINKCVV